MLYFFGASKNCYGAIRFWGKDKIIAVIDNDMSKVGNQIEGLDIISYQDFLEKYAGETVLITAFVAADEIKRQLQGDNINNYFICPYMRTGFFDAEEIAGLCKLYDYKTLFVYEKDLVARRVAEVVSEKVEISVGNVCDKNALVLTYEAQECNNEQIVISTIINEINKTKYEYLSQFRGKHKGESCFLVGMGPSLKLEDLERIEELGIKTISCNKGYRLFEETEWRPSYYVVVDDNVYRTIEEDIMAKVEAPIFVKDFYGTYINHHSDNIYPFLTFDEQYFPGCPQFSDDLVKGIYGGRTVMYEMLQIAVYLGFETIYLIGVDFTWGEAGNKTHVIEDEKDKVNAMRTVRYRDEQKNAYLSARNYADTHGVTIKNATRGGMLDIFERVDIDIVLENRGSMNEKY